MLERVQGVGAGEGVEWSKGGRRRATPNKDVAVVIFLFFPCIQEKTIYKTLATDVKGEKLYNFKSLMYTIHK